jgi:CMP-N-acetylneuraminic acid synthetase
MKTLALITARGGSKGLPKKNILPIAGKPLIAWTIEQATMSKHVDRVVVSTDNAEIAEVARKCGADVPFMRPAELATDEAKTIDVVLHALAKLEEDGDRYDALALLEPTFPTRDARDIDRCIEILGGNPEALAIVTVAKLTSTHPEFNVVIDERGFIKRWDGGNFGASRRQDLSDLYYFGGGIYVSRVQALKERRTFYHDLTLAYVVPEYRAIEVDDIYTLVACEAIILYIKRM